MFYIGLKGLPHRRKSVAVAHIAPVVATVALVDGLAATTAGARVPELVGLGVVVVLVAVLGPGMAGATHVDRHLGVLDRLGDLLILRERRGRLGLVLTDLMLVDRLGDGLGDRHGGGELGQQVLRLLRDAAELVLLLCLDVQPALVLVEPLGHLAVVGVGAQVGDVNVVVNFDFRHGVESEIEEERWFYNAGRAILGRAILGISGNSALRFDSIRFDSAKKKQKIKK